MSSWVSWLTGRGAATKDSTREAIVNLREHLLMLDKKEEYLGKKIDDEVRKARAHATTNPRGQSRSLRRFHRVLRIRRGREGEWGGTRPLSACAALLTFPLSLYSREASTPTEEGLRAGVGEHFRTQDDAHDSGPSPSLPRTDEVVLTQTRTQVNAIESANMNKETLEAMKKGADVLKGIHGKLCVFSTLFPPPDDTPY